jgi:hypothetical protein
MLRWYQHEAHNVNHDRAYEDPESDSSPSVQMGNEIASGSFEPAMCLKVRGTRILGFSGHWAIVPQLLEIPTQVIRILW